MIPKLGSVAVRGHASSSALLVVAVLTCACSPEESNQCELGRSARPIYGGSADLGALELSSAQLASIVRVVGELPGGDSELCSGQFVAEDWVLTAKHCPATFVELDPGDGGPSTTRLVEATRAHSEFDLLLLRVQKLAPLRPMKPIDRRVSPLDASWEGSQVVLAGFGDTSTGPATALQFATEQIVAVTEDTITVDGNGTSGACLGDSGGPLLAFGSQGVELLGTLSKGSSSCLGEDVYVRIDRAAPWIAESTGAVASEPCP